MKLVTTGFLAVVFGCVPLAAQTGASQTTDQAFIDLAAQSDMTEAHLGQLAQQNGSSQAVKDLATKLVTDHTADYTKLTMLATKAGLTVPKGLGADQIKIVTPLEKLKGAAFDSKFMKTILQDHETAIAAYNKESRDAQNADLKAYATATLPTLEEHEHGAKDVRGSKKKAS